MESFRPKISMNKVTPAYKSLSKSTSEIQIEAQESEKGDQNDSKNT
jgi:hypothetical protein